MTSGFNPFGFILCNEQGHPFDTKCFEEGFKKYLSIANLREINVHATRHTFATEALLKTTDIVTVSEILGHAAPSTTLNMYGHTFDERKRKLMNMFE